MEMANWAIFYFKEPEKYDEKGVKKFVKPGIVELLPEIALLFENMEDFSLKNIQENLMGFLNKKGVKLRKVAQPLRIAITGKTVSPGIFEIIYSIGKKESSNRIRKFYKYLKEEAN